MRKLDKKLLLHVTAVSVVLVASSGSSQNAAQAVSAAEQMQVREHINKGNYYLGKRQFDKAIAAYEEALGVDSESQAAKDNIVLVYNNWGIMLFQQGKYPDAKQKWERALKLNPTYVSAKKNIQTMKAHLQKIGMDPEEATRGDGDDEKKPPQQSAVILTPGMKQSGGTGDSGGSGASIMFPPNTSSASAAVKQPSTTTTETSTSSSFPSGAAGGHKKQTYGSGTIMFRPSTPTAPTGDASSATAAPTTSGGSSASSTSSSPFSSTPSVTPSPPAVSTPPVVSTPSVTASPPVTSTPPAASTPQSESTGQTIDEKLASIELKVYGRKLGDLPVMKRLEKLENDTIGQVGSGTVYQRVENLKRHYGM